MAKKIDRDAPKPANLTNMPRDLRQLTVEQFESWARWLAASKPLTGKDSLRSWQSLCDSQTKSARDKLDAMSPHADRTPMEDCLVNCRIMHAVGSAAVAIQQFGDDPDGGGWEAHIPRELRQPA